ncbi:hypothetical protein, partial [Pseudomonas helleri]
ISTEKSARTLMLLAIGMAATHAVHINREPKAVTSSQITNQQMHSILKISHNGYMHIADFAA